MNIVGVFDFSRSVRTADHPRVWQHGGANEALDSRSASRCPSAVFAVVDLHRQDRGVPYGIRAKQVLI